MTQLIISPQTADICTAEFSNLVSWSQRNKLTINLTKTKNLFFVNRQRDLIFLPDRITNVESTDEFRLLGVLATSSFLWTNMSLLF